MQNRQACIWSTSKDSWDKFLNDPELARAIDSARVHTSVKPEVSTDDASIEESETAGVAQPESANAEPNIGARLRAYETPVTDDILRQSIS